MSSKTTSIVVATPAALAAVWVAPLAEGSSAYVTGTGQQLVLRKASTLTPDGVYVVAPNAGAPIAGAATAVWVDESVQEQSSPGAGTLYARGVQTSNVADLTAFTVATVDGVTYTAGQRILLVGQTTLADSGLYVVGTVAAGVAPLTRAPEMASGKAFGAGGSPPLIVNIVEGTLWLNSQWKSTRASAGVIGTNDPQFYPKQIARTITLVAGTLTLGAGGDAVATPVLATTSSVQITRNTSGTAGGAPTATTGGYASPVASRIPGKAGTGAIMVRAEVAAGTISNADTSTLDVLIVNW